jgi:hypothetical protein
VNIYEVLKERMSSDYVKSMFLQEIGLLAMGSRLVEV